MMKNEVKNELKLKLSPPWQTYVHELEAMFGEDPDITIQYDDEEKEVKLFVARSAKAEALGRILKPEVDFGKVKLIVTVVPPNEEDERDVLDDFRDAFKDNYKVVGVFPVETPIGTYRYVGFEKAVVQFYNDQLDDPYGNKSMLLQDIAKHIFADGLGVNYYTGKGFQEYRR